MQPPIFHYPQPQNTDLQMPPPSMPPHSPAHSLSQAPSSLLPPPVQPLPPTHMHPPTPGAMPGPVPLLPNPPPGHSIPPPMIPTMPPQPPLGPAPFPPGSLHGSMSLPMAPSPMGGSFIHPSSLIPPYAFPHQNFAVRDVLPPAELLEAIPDPYEDILDHDIALMICKANKHGGAMPKQCDSRHKYERYVFLAGLLLATRGLPPHASLDDRNDVYVRIMQVYLANPNRLGTQPTILLNEILMKRNRHNRSHKSSHRQSRRRSGSRSREEAVRQARRRSTSRGHSNHRSRSRHGSRSSHHNSSSSSDLSDLE